MSSYSSIDNLDSAHINFILSDSNQYPLFSLDYNTAFQHLTILCDSFHWHMTGIRIKDGKKPLLSKDCHGTKYIDLCHPFFIRKVKLCCLHFFIINKSTNEDWKLPQNIGIAYK